MRLNQSCRLDDPNGAEGEHLAGDKEDGGGCLVSATRP
jgi:hypothetical protein